MKQQQFKITLGDDLRAKLDEASSRNGRSIAEEIRQRLEMSFNIRADGRTLDLIFAILILKTEVTRDFGTEWWADERAKSALSAAIADQLMSYKIAADSSAAGSKKDAPQQQPDHDDDPEVIGRAIARNFRRSVPSADSNIWRAASDFFRHWDERAQAKNIESPFANLKSATRDTRNDK